MAIDVESMYRRYGPMVLRRCRRLLGDEQLAVEAMQDTFIRVISNPSLEDRGVSSLLYRMATQVCLNRIRSQRRRPEDPCSELLHRIAHAAGDEERTEARSILDVLLRRVPASSGTIAVMHLLDGMTLQEVAAEVGMSVSGVRKRLRALRFELHELEALEHV